MANASGSSLSHLFSVAAAVPGGTTSNRRMLMLCSHGHETPWGYRRWAIKLSICGSREHRSRITSPTATYPPFFSAFVDLDVWFDPQTATERGEGRTVFPGSEAPLSATISDPAAAVVVTNGKASFLPKR